MLDQERLPSGMTVYSARPKAQGPWPAIVLLHERYGPVKHGFDLVQRLADAGFFACMPDLFHRTEQDRGAIERGEARVEIADDEAIEDIDGVFGFLRRNAQVRSGDIGIIGVCQTGRQPVLYAAHRSDVAAIGVWYGGANEREFQPHPLRPTPMSEIIPRLRCPVLGLFGEKDHIVSVPDVRRFRNELELAGVSFDIRIYRGAAHGWLNDTMPGRYHPEAAAAAWKATVEFLNATLCGSWDPTRVVQRYESNIAPDYDFSKNVRLE